MGYHLLGAASHWKEGEKEKQKTAAGIETRVIKRAKRNIRR
jgi:hypothetical protein